MRELYFEEVVGQCKNEALYTYCTRCTIKGRLRRIMSYPYRIMGIFYCSKCMPDFFTNEKGYLVVKALKTEIKDPVFEDYVKFYRNNFTVAAKKEKVFNDD